MKMLNLFPVTVKELSGWSALWNDYFAENKDLLRALDKKYYEYRYLNNTFSRAYCFVTETKEIIGYCGVNFREYGEGRHRCKTAEFSDFIFDEKYKMQGYAKEILKELFENELKEYDKFIFFPIDRNAFITWKFLLRAEKTLEMNRWFLPLQKTVNYPPGFKFSFFKNNGEKYPDFIQDRKYVHWRYSLHPEEHHCFSIEGQNLQGALFYKEICFNSRKGVEIAKLSFDCTPENCSLADLFDDVVFFLKQKGYAFLIFKTLRGNIYDQYLAEWNHSKSVFEKKYIFVVNNQRKNRGYDFSNFDFDGEETDNPRSVDYIKIYLEG